MTVTYLGSLSLGDSIPGAVAVGVAGSAGITAALPDIQARIDALLAFSPAPVSFTAQLALAQSMVASVQASITLGLSAPSIAAQIAIVAALVAELSATALTINGHLDVILDFQALLGAADIHAYTFSGNVEDLGNEMDVELAGGVPGGSPTDPCDALVFVTTVGATWTAMSQVFKVTP